MDETPTGGQAPDKPAAKLPEEAKTETTETVKTEDTRAEGTTTTIPPVPPAPPAEPYYNRPLKKKDWMLFALIAVSVIAVLLLAATIALAVGSCDRNGRRFGNQMQNKRFFGDQQQQQGNQGMPRFRYTPRNQGQLSQPQAPQTSPSAPQLAPAPGQSP